jgi:aryl-alcohol dehydrogenase-like predicted oxidoreductase
MFSPEALKANLPHLSLVREWALRKAVTPVQLSHTWLLAQKPFIILRAQPIHLQIADLTLKWIDETVVKSKASDQKRKKN